MSEQLILLQSLSALVFSYIHLLPIFSGTKSLVAFKNGQTAIFIFLNCNAVYNRYMLCFPQILHMCSFLCLVQNVTIRLEHSCSATHLLQINFDSLSLSIITCLCSYTQQHDWVNGSKSSGHHYRSRIMVNICFINVCLVCLSHRSHYR